MAFRCPWLKGQILINIFGLSLLSAPIPPGFRLPECSSACRPSPERLETSEAGKQVPIFDLLFSDPGSTLIDPVFGAEQTEGGYSPE